jgi:DNA-binding NtrC family response regulator
MGKGAAEFGVPSGGRILVVDDEPDILEALSAYLEGTLSVEVAVAHSGPHALEVMAAAPADVVMSDFRMPGQDGLQLLAEFRRRWPEVPRILMTAFADMQLAIRAVNESHVSRFVTKPIQPEPLAAILKELLSQSQLARQRLAALRRSSELAGSGKP